MMPGSKLDSRLLRWLSDAGNQDRQDWLAGLILLALIVLLFSKTVVLGLPISKISRLNEWDSLYGAFWTGRGGNCDPSIVQLLVPYHFLVAKIWLSGHLPLWNPFSGFGTPLLGDIQAAVISPLRFLFDLNPSMRAYNLLLVSEVFGAALGTFLVARALEFKRYTSLIAAVTFALCPYNLYYLENMSGPSTCLLPALLLLFVRVARNPTIGRASVAGIGCAAAILSGHPENSFFNISFASLLLATLMFMSPAEKSNPWQQLLFAVRSLSVTGLTAFCLSAPVLLPFIEYLLNSDSYKFGIGGSTWVPWQGIGYNLLQPGFKAASPYLGVLSAAVLPLSLLLAIKERRALLALLIVSLTAFAFTARLGLLNDVFTTKPFNCLITVYCLPAFLLLATLICARGVEELAEQSQIAFNATFGLLFCGTVLVAGTPWLLHAAHVRLAVGDFDMMIPHMAVDFHAWYLQIGLLIAAIATLFASKNCRWIPTAVLPVVLLVITVVSQVSIAKASLPIQTKFAYPVVDPIPLLQKSRDRMVAIGDHLCRPSTTAVYGIADIRTHNPLFPNRYTDFMKAAGAQVDMFNQLFTSASSKLLDVANVRYVLSLEPLAGSIDEATDSGPTKMSWEPAPVGTGRGPARATPCVAPPLPFSVPLGTSLTTASTKRTTGEHPHGTGLQPGNLLGSGVQPGNPHSSGVQPGNLLGSVGAALAAALPVPPRGPDANQKLKLLTTTSQGIHVYERQGYMPRAYIVHNWLLANSPSEALSIMNADKFDPRKEAVIEAPLIDSSRAGAKTNSQSPDQVEIAYSSPNQLRLNTVSGTPGLLVLADTFYPGWTARLDGREVSIVRANYLFRGVSLPAGKHELVFEYLPTSFIAGVLLAIGSIALLILLAIFKRAGAGTQDGAVKSAS